MCAVHSERGFNKRILYCIVLYCHFWAQLILRSFLWHFIWNVTIFLLQSSVSSRVLQACRYSMLLLHTHVVKTVSFVRKLFDLLFHILFVSFREDIAFAVLINSFFASEIPCERIYQICKTLHSFYFLIFHAYCMAVSSWCLKFRSRRL